MLSFFDQDNDRVQRIKRYCKVMLNSLYFVQTFTDDLLNMAAIKKGMFQLNASLFNPAEELEFISQMFEQLSFSKNIKIECR